MFLFVEYIVKQEEWDNQTEDFDSLLARLYLLIQYFVF